MKHPLLAAALLGLTSAAVAQTAPAGPWVEVNTTAFSTPSQYGVDHLVALSPTFAWGLAYYATALGATYSPRNQSVRTTNAAGTEFDFRQIAATIGFQPINISVPAGVVGNGTAFCAQFSSGPAFNFGGEVIRTTDGGVNWQRITNNTQFASPDGFCDWVHAFDANTAVAAGDQNPLPTTGPGQFEFLYTTNASALPATTVVWTRATMPPPLDAEEYPMFGDYAVVGHTIWTGTMHEPGGVPGPVRILRSTDRGRTWTAHNTPMPLGSIQRIAFKDTLHGVAFTRTTNDMRLMTTADGGLTWTLQTLPDPATADTVRGKFYRTGVTAIPGVGFVSYGSVSPYFRPRSNFGASFSPDGVGKSWTDVEKGRNTYLSASFVACGAGGYQGYLGGITASATASSPGGQGGIFQIMPGSCAAVPLATRPEPARRPTLRVWPNPASSGVFQLQLPPDFGAGTRLTVADALGRPVLHQTLAAPAAGASTVAVDLHHEPAGVYTLRLTTAGATATQRLVRE